MTTISDLEKAIGAIAKALELARSALLEARRFAASHSAFPGADEVIADVQEALEALKNVLEEQDDAGDNLR